MIKKKKIVQIVIFVFLATFLFVNCERDDLDYSTVKKKYNIEKITFDELKRKENITSIVKSINRQNNLNHSSNKNVVSNDSTFVILTNTIMQATIDSITNYTFNIERLPSDSLKFESLIISKNNNNDSLKYYLFETIKQNATTSYKEYSLTIEELDENLISMDLLKNRIYEPFSADCAVSVWLPCGNGGNADGHAPTGGNCVGSPFSHWDLSGCNNDQGGGTHDSNDLSNGGSSGSGNPSGVPSGIVAVDDLPTLTLDTPCDNLLDILKPASIKAKINILRTHSADQTTTGEDEKGFRIRKNPNDNAFTPSAIKTGSDNGEEKNVDIVPTPYTIAVAHTHPPNGVAFFSPQDVLYLARMANSIATPGSTNNIDPLNLTMFLIVDSQTFAIRFDDLDTIQILKDIYSDMEERDRFIRELNQNYKKDSNFLTGERSDITDQQGHLLTFLDDYNLNVSIYEATYLSNEIQSWEKFNNDGSTEPCN